MNTNKNYFDYCEILENQGEYKVKFGYKTYKENFYIHPY